MNRNTDFIAFARPSLGEEEEEAVLRVLRSGWLTTGSETLSFEREFGEFVGTPHALAVNSATSGLHLALEAIGIGPGDVVATSPYTFTSTAAVVRHLGFCRRRRTAAPS
jgi:dTDP-4-amino-4,6-dideoxygalactose transaminase